MAERRDLPVDEKRPRTGVIAMIDALAFKGIWKEKGFTSVVERLEYIAEQAEEERHHLEKNHPMLATAVKFELQLRLLSDTVVVAAHTSAAIQSSNGFRPDHTDEEFWAKVATDVEHRKTAINFVALKLVVGVLVRVLGAALAGSNDPDKPILNYRGAVSYGEYLITKNFLIGQAVDDCAEWFEKADGAFVMFHPTAGTFWDECQNVREAMEGGIVRTGELTVQELKSYMELCEVLEYDVPCKKGEPVNSYVVNPFSRYTRENWDALKGVVIGNMKPRGHEPDDVKASIERKRANTDAYLSWIIENAPACFPPKPPGFEEAIRILEGERK